MRSGCSDAAMATPCALSDAVPVVLITAKDLTEDVGRIGSQRHDCLAGHVRLEVRRETGKE
jgi:hypothetical protein